MFFDILTYLSIHTFMMFYLFFVIRKITKYSLLFLDFECIGKVGEFENVGPLALPAPRRFGRVVCAGLVTYRWSGHRLTGGTRERVAAQGCPEIRRT